MPSTFSLEGAVKIVDKAVRESALAELKMYSGSQCSHDGGQGRNPWLRGEAPTLSNSNVLTHLRRTVDCCFKDHSFTPLLWNQVVSLLIRPVERLAELQKLLEH